MAPKCIGAVGAAIKGTADDDDQVVDIPEIGGEVGSSKGAQTRIQSKARPCKRRIQCSGCTARSTQDGCTVCKGQ